MIWEVQNGGSDTLCGGGFRGGSNLAVPSAPTVSNSATGGNIAANTYYIVVTHTDSTGQTGKSTQSSTTTTGTISTITVNTPATPTDGQYWTIYAGTVSGGPYFIQGGARAYGTNVTLVATPATSGTEAPGVDYSVQTSAQVNVNNSTITATTAGANSNVMTFTLGYTPTSADIGNTFQSASGTNINAGVYEITDFSSTTWTVTGAQNLTTAGGAGSAIVGKMGGCFATPGKAAGVANTSRNGIFVKYNASVYTISGSNNVAGGKVSLPQGCWISGYDTTRTLKNLDTNRPIFNTNANTMTVVYMGGTCLARQIEITNTNVNTAVIGFQHDNSNSIVEWCKTTGMTTGVKTTFQISETRHCEMVNYTSIGFDGTNAVDTHVFDCLARGGTLGTSKGFSQHKVTDHCVCAAGNGDGFDIVDRNWLTCCVADGLVQVTVNGGNGFNIAGSTGAISMVNCAVSNCLVGLKHAADSNPAILRIEGLGTYNNTTTISVPTPALQKIDANSALITVGTGTASGNPWTNTATFNFTTNATVNAGAVFRAGGRPTLLPGGAGTSFPDIGYAQHADPGATGGLLVHPGMGGGARG